MFGTVFSAFYFKSVLVLKIIIKWILNFAAIIECKVNKNNDKKKIRITKQVYLLSSFKYNEKLTNYKLQTNIILIITGNWYVI